MARGGGAGGRGPQPTMDKPKREAILDLSKYTNERIRVKFTGGREGAFYKQCEIYALIYLHDTLVTGVLKGFDQLLNLVLDDVEENIQTENETTARSLGLVVLRGPTITLLSPVDGSEEIANPFLAQEA
ncbi:hypothetical protein BDY19DRAFT_589924 [Irpex rosettiformis]|uniref:Uncharacterized protein n=1 Tax=Irpex rosettiformis TaxID=378272 RepID=A0ACB8UD57_9APHY|nr:hypothetical protein BDY19DRAFT_589924 [Irpex rosettiformis]